MGRGGRGERLTVTSKTKVDNNITNKEGTVKLNKWKKKNEAGFIHNLNQNMVNDITGLLDQIDSSVDDVN